MKFGNLAIDLAIDPNLQGDHEAGVREEIEIMKRERKETEILTVERTAF